MFIFEFICGGQGGVFLVRTAVAPLCDPPSTDGPTFFYASQRGGGRKEVSTARSRAEAGWCRDLSTATKPSKDVKRRSPASLKKARQFRRRASSEFL
jgi:hypothetical protein